jgi:hypothetical protein
MFLDHNGYLEETSRTLPLGNQEAGEPYTSRTCAGPFDTRTLARHRMY